MANNIFQVKRTSTSGNIPTNSQISIGELAINLPDGIMYSTNGTVVFPIGANNVNLNVSNSINVGTANVLAATYDGLSVNTSTDTTVGGVFFRPDGLRMILTGTSNDNFDQYDLSVAWNVATATITGTFSLTHPSVTQPSGLFISPDGGNAYVTDYGANAIAQYTLATPWQVNTATYANSFSTTTWEDVPMGVHLTPNGSVMFFVGNVSDQVHKCVLSTPWNIGTAAYSSNLSISAQEPSASDLTFTSDGRQMLILGASGDDVDVYVLSTAWDISTAVYRGTFSVQAQGGGTSSSSPSSIYINPDSSKLYVGDQLNTFDGIYQYSIPSALRSQIMGTVDFHGNTTVEQDLTVRGRTNVTGDLSFVPSSGPLADKYNRFAVIPSGTTVYVDVPSAQPTVKAAVDAIRYWVIPETSSVVIRVAGHITESAAITINRPNVTIRGATPTYKSIVSINSVTGTVNNYVVTATLSDNTNIAVGDALLIRGVRAGCYVSPGSYTGPPQRGELQLGYYDLGGITTSGNTVTVTGAVDCNTFIDPGYLLLAKGEIKSINVVSTSSFTISSPLAKDITSELQYWYFTPPCTGTVTSSGNTITGTGTSFTTEVNVGDMLCFENSGVRQVTSITNATSLNVAFNVNSYSGTVPNLASGTKFGVITNGDLHEGCVTVTSVSGNTVTWDYKGKNVPPPVNNVTAGNVAHVNTTLTFATTSGFMIESGALDIDQIAMYGSLSSTSVAALDGRNGVTRDFGGQVRIGASFGVRGFAYGGRFNNVTGAYLNKGHFSLQRTRGVELDINAGVDMTDCIINECGGIPLLVAGGSAARTSSSKMMNCNLQGIRIEVGGSVWNDFGHVFYSGGSGILLVGGCEAHLVGSRVYGSGDGQIQTQNGGHGRSSGAVVIGGSGTGFTLYNALWESGQCFVNGNKSSGLSGGRSSYSGINSGYTFNGLYNVQAIELASYHLTTSTIMGANSIGVYCDEMSKVIVSGSHVANNGGQDLYVLSGDVLANGATFGTTIPALLNFPSNTGGFIDTGVASNTTYLYGNVIISNGGLSANGSYGSAGQSLTSNGSAVYWASAAGSGTVTSVDSANGIGGGAITGSGTLYVVPGTGIVANSTGVHVNAAYIATLGGGLATAEVEIDFGSTPVFSKTLTATVTGANSSHKIIVTPSLTMPSDVDEDEWEMDTVVVAAKVTANDTVKFVATALPGPITGKRNFNVSIG